MILSHLEKNAYNRDTIPIPHTKEALEKEKKITQFLRKIQIAGFVIDLKGRVYEVDMIAGNEIHLVPLEKNGTKLDPKGKTLELMKKNLEEMVDRFMPCNQKGQIIIDPRKRVGRDTNEGNKIVAPIGADLRKEAGVEPISSYQGKNNSNPTSEQPVDETERIDGKPHYQVETPYAKTEAQRKVIIERRKAKVS